MWFHELQQAIGEIDFATPGGRAFMERVLADLASHPEVVAWAEEQAAVEKSWRRRDANARRAAKRLAKRVAARMAKDHRMALAELGLEPNVMDELVWWRLDSVKVVVLHTLQQLSDLVGLKMALQVQRRLQAHGLALADPNAGVYVDGPRLTAQVRTGPKAIEGDAR